MAVAPLGADPAAAFEQLRAASGALRAQHPGATVVSAGMSGDLEQAVAAGATHVRVGTAVLGGRPSARVASHRTTCGPVLRSVARDWPPPRSR